MSNKIICPVCGRNIYVVSGVAGHRATDGTPVCTVKCAKKVSK